MITRNHLRIICYVIVYLCLELHSIDVPGTFEIHSIFVIWIVLPVIYAIIYQCFQRLICYIVTLVLNFLVCLPTSPPPASLSLYTLSNFKQVYDQDFDTVINTFVIIISYCLFLKMWTLIPFFFEKAKKYKNIVHADKCLIMLESFIPKSFSGSER